MGCVRGSSVYLRYNKALCVTIQAQGWEISVSGFCLAIFFFQEAKFPLRTARLPRRTEMHMLVVLIGQDSGGILWMGHEAAGPSAQRAPAQTETLLWRQDGGCSAVLCTAIAGAAARGRTAALISAGTPRPCLICASSGSKLQATRCKDKTGHNLSWSRLSTELGGARRGRAGRGVIYGRGFMELPHPYALSRKGGGCQCRTL